MIIVEMNILANKRVAKQKNRGRGEDERSMNPCGDIDEPITHQGLAPSGLAGRRKSRAPLNALSVWLGFHNHML